MLIELILGYNRYYQMNRLEVIQKIIDSVLMEQTDLDVRQFGFIHLYGVSSFCSLLAKNAGLRFTN